MGGFDKRLGMPAMAALLLLSGCGDADLPADEQGREVADASASGSAIDQAAADAAGEGGFSTGENDSTMPTGMRGRWGLVELDCTGDPAAAKGLIAIEAQSIKFYESRARIAAVESRDDDRIAGRFDFEGEGQTWSLDMDWTLGGDGRTLVRTESGADAAPEPLEYQKCNHG